MNSEYALEYWKSRSYRQAHIKGRTTSLKSARRKKDDRTKNPLFVSAIPGTSGAHDFNRALGQVRGARLILAPRTTVVRFTEHATRSRCPHAHAGAGRGRCDYRRSAGQGQS
ncbi:hypothetical protein DBA26_07010 [Brucella canis]|nr:hypothetical protein DMP29_05365 [Brucella suis]RXX15830.1 hypothetical protein DBA27_00730 [Brucella canis]RXX16406.1 hypothetical protein DBA26_07010 [Brucella canis]TFZ72950.1 hypothetical protein E4658_03760 [Brucella suis]